MVNYIGIDIIIDDVNLKDYLSNLKGEVRVTDVPFFSTIEASTNYDDVSPFSDGQRAIYTSVGSSSRVVTMSIYGSLDFINKATTAINRFAFGKEVKKIQFGDNQDWYWLGRVNSAFAPTLSSDSSSPYASGSLTFNFDDARAYSSTVRKIEFGKDSDYGTITKKNNHYTVELKKAPGARTEPVITIKNIDENGYIGLSTATNVFALGNEKSYDNRVNTILDARTDNTLVTAFESSAKNSAINVLSTENEYTGALGIQEVFGRKNIALTSRGRASATFDLGDDPLTKSEYIWWRETFWAGRVGQTGSVKILVSDQNNKLLYGVETLKNTRNFNTPYKFIGSKPDGSYIVLDMRWFKPSDSDNDNQFNRDRGWSAIRREGNHLAFYWFGGWVHFDVPEHEGRRATKLHVIIESYGDEELVTHAYVSGLEFKRSDAESLSDVKNVFGKNSLVKIDNATRDVEINGLKKISDVADGSSYLYFDKNNTTLDISLSEWIEKDPEISLEYRERDYL